MFDAPPFPLSDEATTALAAVADGHDHNETAFALLVDALRTADLDALEPLGPAPLPREAMLADDDSVRGSLVRVSGVLAQASPLEEFWEGVAEWFVRLPDGNAVCVFVVDPPPQAVRGIPVELVGATYKRIDAVGRDGVTRSFPAIVARVRRVGAAPSAIAPLATVVVAMLVGLVFVRARVKKTRAKPQELPARISGGARPAPRETPTLPPDPADALAALRERHYRA
ncbi:MAG: hypothetical protein JNM94_04065 [Phycisphaerae bacterium]|nr:hypothetical protein [Phycisphaerae bacterium]